MLLFFFFSFFLSFFLKEITLLTTFEKDGPVESVSGNFASTNCLASGSEMRLFFFQSDRAISNSRSVMTDRHTERDKKQKKKVFVGDDAPFLPTITR